MNTVATVISVSGLAWVQDASGERRLLTPGDQIQPGESLVTTASTRVVLDFGGQRPLAFVGAEPGTEEVAQTADIPVILLPAPAAGEKPATSPDGSGKVPVEEGHGFVQLVKIGEIVEADGITPLTVAAIRELLDPLAMGWPDPEEELDEERYNRGGDDGMVFVDNVAPGVSVELQGSGPDGTYNDVEIGPDGTVTAEVTLQPGTEKGDLLVVTDKDGNVLLERSVTEDDLTQGIRVEVPVSPGDRDVTVNASITDPVGNSGQDTDSKPVDWQVTVDIPSDQDATTPDGMNTDQVVFERGLASGSDPSLADTQVHSQFTLTALDGLADSNALTLAYTDASGQPATLTLSKTQVEELGTAPQAITTSYGELVLNGYSQAADGTLTLDYDYTLTHAPEVAGSDTNDTFTITATDRDGGSHSDDLSIKIVDDAPLANDDRNSITEDVVSVSGNVIAQGSAGDVADTQGADGARVGGVISDNVPSNAATEVNTELVIEGQYGTLTIQADGRYSYVLDSSYLEVQGLIVGETLDEVFTYTLTDGDGDSADAALTITISGADDGVTVDVPSDTTVTTPDADNTDQVVFESGLASGSDPSLADTQVHSQFTLTALDGLADINAVTLVYTDANGQPVTLTLSKTQLEELGTAPQAITTSYGELVLNGYSQAADGTLTLDYDYTLTTAPGVSGTDINDTVTITATDRDGDRHSDDLNIKIVDDAPQAADDANSLAEGATLTVDAASGVLANDVAGADGWADSGAVVGVVAGNSGTTSSGGVGGRIDGQYGYLTLNADGSYEYVSTADAIAADAQDIFTYTVRDDDGDETSTTLTINVADVSLPDTPITDTVTESGLPDGSDEGNGGHTTTGKVTLPEGVSAVPVTDVPTEYGIFTIDEEGNYSYTLTDITTGDEVTDSFTYTSQDEDGNTVSNSVTITIVDDVPVAVADENSVTEDAVPNPVTGNVLSGESAGDRADTQGADGARVSGVQAGSIVAGEHVADGNLSTAISGQYGSLVLQPDGSYSYQLNNNNPMVNALKDGDILKEVFSYTLTDADGDRSSTTLTITINGNTDGAPAATVVDHNGADVGDHSIAEDATSPVSGTFSVSAPDGLKSINIGGETLTVTDLAALNDTSKSITGSEGVLTLTGYDVRTGELSYTYQQSGSNKDHSGGDNSVTDSFAITVTDNADVVSAAESLDILITDTAPEANADTNSVTEDSGTPATGNVISDSGAGQDELGADSTTVTGVSSGNLVTELMGSVGSSVVGSYGTLVLGSDGKYSYVLDDSNADVNALKDGETLTDTFSYTIKDADGDWSTTTLTITIDGNTDGAPSITPADDNGNGAIDGDNSVHESGLTGGSSAGDDSQITSGSIQISAGDGLASITIGGQGFTLAELQALNAGSPSAAISVDGGTLVLTGFTASSSVGGVPTSGTLAYTYTLSGERTHSGAGNDDVQLSIPLSVTDAGNATANGRLTIEVIDDVPTAIAETASVGEGATLSVDAASGVLSNDVAGADGWADSGAVVGVVAGDTGTTSSGGVGGRIDGNYGYLTLNADGSYVYVSTANAITGDEVEVFTYTVRDGDGDLSSTTLSINVADVTLSPVNESDSVNESGLSGGSSEGDGSHSTSSQVTVPPGLEVVPGSGTTTHGTFTIDEDGNYTYTLTETTSGDATSDSFSYVTKDANGNTVTNTVTVDIVNDVPVAVDDTNSIPSGSYAAVTGELIDGGLGGAGQDTEGADGATVTAVTNSAASTSETVPSDGSSITINGQYGVLTIEADGSYSYQRNPGTPGGVQDVFEYTLTDSDNDTDTATLTIDIGNAVPSISGLTPSTSGGELFFEERHLADGSAPDSSQLSKLGSFTVSSPDGIASLVVGGVTVISDGALTATTTVTTPQGHTLEVTGFDPLTGVVSYEYTLTGRENHDQSVSDNELFDDIGISLLDQDGQSASDTLSVRIVDDEPQANNDSNRLDEDTTSVSGNVIANGASGDVADTEGADGATVTDISSTSGNPVDDSDPAGELVVVGEYGTLTIQPDGSYEYVLNNDSAGVNALKDGETLSEVFTYTLTDADGDADTATLTITIDGNTDGAPSITPADDNGNGAIDGDNTVRESGLAGGSSAGDDSQITSGSIQISAGDGLASITIGGQGFTLAELQALSAGSPSAAISVEGGTLVLTGFTASSSVGGVPTSGTLAYTYTLIGERTHSSTGNDDIQLSIPLSVTDAGKATANGSLTIEVVDDVPTAVNDSASVAAGEFQLVTDGNVLDNDTQGADGARVTGVGHEDDASETAVPGTGNLVIDGDYGKLTIHSDGSYSYQRNAGTPGGVQDVFTYTITDGDEDTANAELTIHIADDTPAADIPSAGGASTRVYESGLPDGSDNIPDRATTSGTIEFTSADGLLTVSLGGNTLSTVDQTFATSSPDGSLTARYEYDPATGEGVIHYSYTLKETTTGDDTSASFPLVVTDQDGDSSPGGNLMIAIVDDRPRAVNDQGTVTEGDSLSVNATDGVLGNDNAGADGWNGAGAVVGVEAGNTGTTSASGVATVINGAYGTLTLNADGSYTYVSTANAVTADAVDVFTYTVRDADGDETTATLTINVNDVTGTPRDTADSVDEAGLSAGTDSASDKEVAEGSLNLDSGWTVASGSVGTQGSSVGTLRINADGSYRYTLNSETTDVAGVTETDTFSYVAVDQFGNTVTNTVTITIIDDVPSVTLTGSALDQLQVDETSMGVADSADFSGAFSHHFGADGDNGDGLVFTLEVDAAATGLVDTLTGQDIALVDNAGVIEGRNEDGKVVFTVSVDASGEVTLTQSRPVQHGNASDHDDVVSLPAGSLSLTARATDGDNDTTSNSVDIGGRLSFRDDGPSIGASPAVGAVDEAWLTTGSGDGNPAISTTTEADLNVDFGADGQGALVFSDDQVALRNWLDASGNTDISVTGTGTSVLTGTRGGQEIFTVTLTVDGSGQAKYSFELKGAMLHRSPTQDHELTFSYDALDGDDDSVSGTFRVDVKDDEPRSDIAIEVDEDGSEGPFTTSADATQDNTSISTTSGGAPIVGTDGPEGRDYDVGHGTVTVHDDGRLTYTPNPDYSNYGGSDEFYVTVTEDNGAQQTIRVTATVNPVADAPELTVDAASVSTDEDVAISLGLNTPEVSDDNDQNLAATGDDPELLGLITLSGIPDGAALLDGLNADAELVVSSGGDISILLSDGPHLSDLLASPPAGTLVISSAQFEALKVLPAADAHENFTVGVSVTSYEVDGTGTRVPGVDGAESTASVAVNVDAVTDPVSLTFDDDTDTRALTINEDSTYDLTAALKVEYPDNDGNTSPDLDGSEERWFEIAGLPVGSTVTTVGGDIEVTADDPVVRVPAPGLSTSSTVLPQMDITPPADYSGGAVAVTVTLKAQDRDSDSPAATPAIVQDSVTLNLQVDPVPDAPVVEGVSTAEDTAVAFLANVQPGDTDGSEELMAITVKDIPAGWTVQDHLGNTLTPTAGELQIDPSDVASGDYQSYTIQPAGHSSLDVTLKLDIEVRDNSNDGAVGPTTQVFTDIDLDVEVTPVAETTDTDTNGVGGNDVTLTPGHDYTTSGEEDAWFSLGAELGFTLSDDWANEDSGSEKTFALLTPNLEHGDGSAADALGSSFRYSTDGGTSWVTQTYGGDPIEVPVEYLDTLQFKAAPNFSGSFSIDVQALTRDYDEDDLGAGNTVNDLTPAQLAALSYDEAISGSAVLTNVLIKPVADTATTTVTAHVRGNEDEVMPLSIRPSSSDPSETFNVTISAIPDGATLVYDGVTLTADATGLPAGFTIVSSGDTWSLSIDGFDPDLGAGMTIQAPEDSNEPFTLTVDTVSVDTLDVPGDLGSPYVSESSAYSLDILISPRGVADEAQLTIVDPADQTFEESTVDANGGVALNELIASAALTDDDGSEVLSFRVSNLPEGFSLQGGTLIGDGVWSLTEAQLQTAKLVTPANFNGTASFNFYSVTTEDDGDSLTELHAVSLRVQPAPEATINLSASIDEDVSTALSFGIQHQNGDTDEQLDAVWLSASDVDGATDFTLTYGASGVSLAQAVTDGLPGITLEDGWYKLSGDALTSIHAQGRENWSGSAEIDVRYLITDPAADGTVSDVQSATDDSYSITVNPVTDQPVLTVTGGETSSLAAPGDVVVDLNIANQGGDYDGSEQLNRIILDNVPDGVIVEGAEYLGGGQWMLAPESAFGGELTPSVTLKVQGRAGGLENYPIQVTVITEDSANGQQLTDSTTISLTTTFAEGEATPPAEILQWEQSDFEPTEDTAFTLDQGINAEIESGVTDNGFTVTLTDLPAGTTVSGMRLTVIDGQQVWTASGVGGDAELQTLLNSIAVTPPADWNKHDGDFVYNAELTTYIPSGDRAEAEITMQQTVVPVTDDADILITAPAVAEGSDLEISIDISNAADDPNWTLIDGLLYVTLNEPADMQGGVLQDELGNPLSQSAVSGVEGVPDGSYYVLDVSGGGNSANLRYTPVNQYVSGSIGLGVVARGQELDSSLVKTTTTTATATIEPVNSGYDLAVADTTGSENTFAQAQTDKSNVIQLQVTDGGLVDADGSESVGTILLNGLPNGFLVYVGSSAADATLASLGSNAGANSDGSNTWLLGEGELPGYIGIMPPAHWSGTLDGLRLLVNSQEAALSQVSATEREFSLTVEAVAEGLELNPTPSFGPEGDIIRLNLNIEMNDIGQAGADDSSVETITLQFKGMGEHAAFYLDDVLISGGPNVTYADGVYTIVGLTQEQVDSLGFVQSADALGNVEGRGRTVESENGDASEWTHDEAAAWASISTNISTQYGTTEDDQLMWTGSLVDGRSGEDTIQLRFNESVDGTDLGNYARNIESIDLTGMGTNTVVDLGVQDVLDMTDGNNKLTIGGDAGDSVSLTGGEWSAGSVNGNYIIYTGTLGNDTVVLEVQSLLID